MRIATAVLIGAALLAGGGCNKAKPTTPAPAPAGGAPGRAADVAGVDVPPANPPPRGGGGGGGFGGGGGGGVMAVRKAVDREKAANDLKQIGLFYQQYCDENGGRGPANQQQFITYIQRDAGKIVRALNDGWYVVYWNVSLGNLPQGASNTVLAYEKEVPTSDGMVVMGDGSVTRISAQQFAAAAKPPQ